MCHEIILKGGVCILLFTIASCLASGTSPSKETAEVGRVEAAQLPSRDSNDASEVIISLGGKRLTMGQVRWMRPDAEDRQIAVIAKWWLETELLYAEAEKVGITNEAKAKFFAEMMRKSSFGKEVMTRVQDAVETTDADVLAHYEKNKKTDRTLMQPGNLSFSHVRTKTLKEAEAVLERLKSGEGINELAKELSISIDARRGGVVRERRHRDVEKRFGSSFLEALEAAKDGELIGPIKVDKDDGYEVARKTGEIKPTPRPFDEVKNRIKSDLQRAGRNNALKSLLDRLKKEAEHKIVKSARLVEIEKAGTEKTQGDKSTPPKPQSKPTEPASPK